MTYDYKRLCNELLSYLYQCDWPDGERFYALVERTRNALAEPEPEGPTRRQLMMLADDMGMASVGDAAEYARAVLARWGNHPGSPDSSALQPISVTERLPGPEDCDAEGRCWAWKLDDEDDAWHLELREWINSPWTTHWLPAHALPQPFCPDPLVAFTNETPRKTS